MKEMTDYDMYGLTIMFFWLIPFVLIFCFGEWVLETLKKRKYTGVKC